jgi:tape measure domain-containing protein
MDAILKITTQGDVSGLNSVAQGLNRITSGAQQSRQAIDRLTAGLSSATAGLGVGLLGKSFLDAGVAADMNTRRVQALAGAYGEIKQVGGVASQAAKQFGLSTVDASNAVADLYGRLRPTGISLSEIQTIFFGVNKAAMTLGMSTLDVSETMQQLSQALGSGKLQGDELRSIMERMPIVGQAVAKVMGVTTSEIKGLGAAGAITTEVLIKAAAELNKLVPPPPTAMQRFTAAIEDLRTEIGIQLLPIITPFVEGLTKALKAASDLPGPLKAAAVAFGTFGVGILAAATAMQALSFASATFAAIKGGPVMAILAGGVGAGLGALAMADAIRKAKQAQEELNTATTQGGTAASQAADEERKKSLAIGEAAEKAAKIKQQQEAFNAAIDQSNAKYKLLTATIDATAQTIQRVGGLRDAELNANIAVNNAAKSILEYKLSQAKTDADKIPILLQIKQIELDNARLQKEALDDQIYQETKIVDLKRQKAWEELRSAKHALATAEAYGQETAKLQEQVNLMKVAANSADSDFKFQKLIADEKQRGAEATYSAQRQVIGFGINELRNQAASAPTGRTFNGAPVLADGRTGMRVNGVLTYAGGGYTGNAPRSGGLDGQGGFMAMLHPRETVIDHAKTSGGGVPNITIRTGEVLQMPDGSQWVSMADLEQAMQATAAGVLGQLRTPAGRVALGGA